MAIKFTDYLFGKALARINTLGNAAQDAVDNPTGRQFFRSAANKRQDARNIKQLETLAKKRDEIKSVTRTIQAGTAITGAGALGTAGYKAFGNKSRNIERDRAFYEKGQHRFKNDMLHDPGVDLGTKLRILESTGTIKVANLAPKAWAAAGMLAGGGAIGGTAGVLLNPKIENNYENALRGAGIGTAVGATAGGAWLGLKALGLNAEHVSKILPKK